MMGRIDDRELKQMSNLFRAKIRGLTLDKRAAPQVCEFGPGPMSTYYHSGMRMRNVMRYLK